MNHLYLIGMMGCGKTTCAALLSEKLGRRFVDTDRLLEEQQGMSVSELFERYGEAYFRQLETALLRSLAGQRDLIVACGGGLPLAAENRTILQESGRTVFLNRDPETIYDAGDMSGRPLGQQGRQAFLERFARREPLYRAAADIIVGSFPAPEETVAEILRQLEETE